MKLKEKLYFNRINALFNAGIKNGLIIPFNDDFYKELNKTIVNTIPVGLDIKYLRPKISPGKCYDRSLKMFLAMDDSILVRGSLEYFRVQGDTEGENHGWVERYGYVYDPTFKCIIDKDYYYKIFKVRDEYKCNHEEYCNLCDSNRDYYIKVKSTTRESLKKDGSDRYQLAMTIPLLLGIANNNEEFRNELATYLKEINYDEEDIQKSIDDEINKAKLGKRLV